MFLLFMLTFIITAKATEDSKYIDLLPEKDKEVFLEKVARRILEEVDSKPSKHKSGGEVPEEELDVHAEFVKKILREEEANFRKNNRNNSEELTVKPLREDKSTIDLTLRSRSRRNHNESQTTNIKAESELGNDNVQNDANTLEELTSDEKSIKIKELKSTDIASKEESETNNDDVQTIPADEVTEKTETPTTEQQDNDTEVINNASNLSDESNINTTQTDKTNTNSNIQSTSKAEESKPFLQTSTSENINDENKKSDKLKDNISIEKQNTTETKFLDIPVQILHDEDVKNVESTSSKASTVPTEESAYATTSKSVDNVETVDQPETTTKTIEPKAKQDIKRDINTMTDKDENNEETKENRTEKLSVKDFRINTANFGESEIESSDTNNTNNNLFIDLKGTPISKEHKDKSMKPIIKRIKRIHQSDTEDAKPVSKHYLEVTTQNIEVLTPLTPLKSKLNTKNEEKYIKEVDRKIIQVLRDVIEKNKVDANGRFDGVKSVKKMKVHKVYELPIPDDKLAKEDNLNKEQPYYYPIYNYSPDNAYYNAHNKFGPNQNDHELQNNRNHEENDQGRGNFAEDYFFNIGVDGGYRNTKFDHLDVTEHAQEKFHFKPPIVLTYPIKSNTDYYDHHIGRNRKLKSKKNDGIEDSQLKNSLRDIRMMMYASKMFGYIPNKNNSYDEIDSSDSSEVTTKKSHLRFDFEAILNRESKERGKQIKSDESYFASDYYLSRMKGDTKTAIFNKYRQNNKDSPILKDVLQKLLDGKKYKIYIVKPKNLKTRINIKYLARNKPDDHNNKPDDNNNKPKLDLEKIKQILDIANEEDRIPTLNALLKMNITRSGGKNSDVEIYVDVLADMVQTDNSALVQYDWLGTTVNIQGAILKLHELSQIVLNNKYINPSDFELLKYTIYLYKQASIMTQNHEVSGINLRKGKKIMNKKVIKVSGLIDKLWVYRQSAEAVEKNKPKLTKDDLTIFGEFLDELLNYLYELHTAIKEIASITKYNHQNWFKNLKDLYLKRTRITNLELLLHLTANRVLDLVEESARSGLELDYLKYIERNKEEVKRTEKEFVFLMKIMNEIEKNE